MKIGEVKKITGLSSKAIRLYEEKGLVVVKRKHNAYRDYDESCIGRLNQIKMFRDVGIGISQICLYYNGVITLEELINERIDKIRKESSSSWEQLNQCNQLLKILQSQEDIDFEKGSINETDALIGLDIGTTTISVVVIDMENKSLMDSYTIANACKLPTEADLCEYNADWILEKVYKILRFLRTSYPNTKSIGVTGQMHGILYIDENGCAVSPLVNWQDKRGDRLADGEHTYCEKIKALTDYTIYSGYGFTTLYYNQCNGLVPDTARSFCTIMDYISMSITGNKRPLIHSSNAASFGLYDLKEHRFDKEAAAKLGLSYLELPEVTSERTVVGWYDGIPVTVAIGDNQASFYGSVRQEESAALVNYGTGSQISVVIDTIKEIDSNLELRPYIDGKYLLCGSALCGGKAYSLLEKFFSSYLAFAKIKGGSQYEIMNELAEKAYGEKNILRVSTLFCGTRKDPKLRGTITELGEDNFSPEALTLGVLQGMVDELYWYFTCMSLENRKSIVSSGNAVRKNKILRQLLQDTFGCEVHISANQEEAAFGTALFAGICSGVLTESEAKEFIKY